MSTHPITASKEVKTLRKRIKEIGVEISDLNSERQRIQSAITRRNNRIRKHKLRLNELEGVDFTVTDHAILRYLERVDGLDVEDIKAKMLTEELKSQVRVVGGSGKFPGPSGTRLVLENKRVISVIPA